MDKVGKVDIAPSMAMAVALGDTQATIPADKESLKTELDAVGFGISNGEWSRAGAVAAWVRPEASGGRPKKVTINSHFYNLKQFAAEGIVGLTSRDTVRRYIRAWEISGHPMHSPGDVFTFPDLDWSEVWEQVIEEMPTNPGYTPKADPTPDYFGEDGRASQQPSSGGGPVVDNSLEARLGRTPPVEEWQSDDWMDGVNGAFNSLLGYTPEMMTFAMENCGVHKRFNTCHYTWEDFDKMVEALRFVFGAMQGEQYTNLLPLIDPRCTADDKNKYGNMNYPK